MQLPYIYQRYLLELSSVGPVRKIVYYFSDYDEYNIFWIWGCHSSRLCLLHSSRLLRLFLDPEDGVGMFLRNVSGLLSNYTVIRPRISYIS
jgi:hypothetical protein